MPIDMSPKAVRARLHLMDELWELSIKLMDNKKAQEVQTNRESNQSKRESRKRRRR